MRIQKLLLKAFGPFTDCSLSLGPGLNILYGPNEAGKSSALRAIRSLLYGIEAQTADNFLHPYDQLRLGAVLAKQDGQTLEFCRRKGRKNTLRDGADETPLDDAVLEAYLGAVDEDFFLSVFGIDHKLLQQGGEDVVRGGGRIGELLFAAGGVGDLRLRQQQLDSELIDLYKPAGQKPKINKNLSELHALRADVKRLQASSDLWTLHEEELGRIQRRRAELDQELRQKKTAHGRISRIQTGLPSLARWKTESEELAALKDAPLLAEGFAQQLHDALRRINVSQGRESDAKEEVAKLTDEIKGEIVPHGLLAESETIQGLYLRLGSHRKATQDRSGLVTSRQRAQHNAREILRKLGRSDSLDDIEQHRLPDDKHAQIQALANRYEALSERHRSAKRLRDRHQRKLGEEEPRFNDRETPIDASELRKVLKQVQLHSGIEDELADRQSQLDRLIAESELALGQLALWSGSLSELEQLPVPTSESIEHFDDELRDCRTKETALQDLAREAAGEIERLKQAQAEFERGEQVPTGTELVQLRKDRDRGWSLVLADWKQLPANAADIRQFVEQFSPATDLADAFVISIQRADSLADRLRREADRVATKVQLESRMDAIQMRLEKAAKEQVLLEEKRGQQVADWKDRWRASGISPLTPREMRAWLRDYEGILELAKKLENERSAAESLLKRRKSIYDKLVAAMTAVATQVDADSLALLEIIDVAQHRLDALQSDTTLYEQLSKTIARLRQELADAEEDLQQAEAELAAWKSDWAVAMKQLRLPEDATTEQAGSVLGNLTKLFQEHRDAEGFRLRIYGIDADASEFTEDVNAVARRLTPDLVDRPVEEVTTELHARTVQAREAQQRVDSLTEQLSEQQEKLRDAESLISDTNAELAAMRLEAGCARIGDLAEADTRSTQKRHLQKSLANLEEQLRPLSGGHTIEQFAREADQEDADQLAPRKEELDGDIQTLEEERDQLLQAEQREKDELKKMDGNSDAAQKACECEFLLAQLEQELHDYAVLRIASAVLRRAVERYREKAQGPIVARASEVFQVLTRGSFVGLRTDFDEDGQPVLLGVRPGEQATVMVGGMSDGACDQLFLALRIATLEHWFEHHEPMPFIIDDVLLNFDDERAKAALVALAELSRKTQIVFFTHHDHLVSIAKVAILTVLDESEFLLSTDWSRP